ncbi:MAG: DMT family transporter [Candidatus Buchananbacteria bacterium]
MKKYKYLALAVLAAVISGLANFVNKLALNNFADPVQYTFLKNLVAVICLFALIYPSLKNFKLGTTKNLPWIKFLLIGLGGGGLAFIWYFKGLAQTSAINASFIHKTLFVWIACLAVFWLKEKINWQQYAGLAILFGGNYLLFGQFTWLNQPGDYLVFLATLIWAVEFILAKNLLANYSPLMVGFSRLLIGLPLIALFVSPKNLLIWQFNLNQWLWLGLTGVLLALFISTWYLALKNLSVTTVSTILVVASPITTILQTIFVTHNFVIKQGIIYGIFIIGVFLVVKYRSNYNNNYDPILNKI